MALVSSAVATILSEGGVMSGAAGAAGAAGAPVPLFLMPIA